ncbi:MAG: 2,3-bisphosphoglycerate-independent phosphoglycerate mutase [Microgenomates group bacterium GW2011_GWF2_45_18]|nr:MAG: 2,3-bisphosphoglycerate-independent phosphoglycerate mutase [Microgenomates group bacterium GW2011_GWF1_44_10]KKU02182.1 MAG: 2,3-bisphosphoglycerate-independent phosphoglycerate mutase [Microgenomates group bacterium GW2011_GWF2_45_18]HAU99324.1 2,3-bisphosphoglycerate-independent phosphoglycerate mutase [Candidatus Paceibacterota bacterium]HAX01842.1 2,3-bisphosphoglycerate-independent phosphoglycerate mutase [Candidatus Paceibacterota bacterium]
MLSDVPKPIVLLILDGWGVGPDYPGNAITKAHTPVMNRLPLMYPNTLLGASGDSVGLPKGEDGNTETGHLNIGAGRIVYQDLPRINMAIAEGSFGENQAIQKVFEHVKTNNSTLHLMGLIGSGGVHSSVNHLYALLAAAKNAGLTQNISVHAFTDGRDSPPTAGVEYLRELTEHMEKIGVGKLATIVGRYYAMDRDHRWERTQVAYDALTVGSNVCTMDYLGEMRKSYDAGKTDEFIEPISVCGPDGKHRVVQDGDAVMFFNFRIDRPRQLTRAFVLPNFESGTATEAFDPYTVKYQKSHISHVVAGPTFQRKKIIKNMLFTTMTEYERGLPALVAFPPEFVSMPLGRVLSEKGLRQLRISETEKERFVTYYFNGQREDPFFGEDRVIIPSQKVATYDLKPEMSAREIMQTIIDKIQLNIYNVIIVNFANADMVAHTGNLESAIKACEVVDECVGRVIEAVNMRKGVTLITADHGNAEEMITDGGNVDTEHSTYPVPFIIASTRYTNQNGKMAERGILADIAPTILKLLNIERPADMTGRPLI